MKILNVFMVAVGIIFLNTPSKVFAGSTIFVNDPINTVIENGLCSLSEAILNSNNNDQSGSTDCEAGTGLDTIVFLTDIHSPEYFLNGFMDIFSTPLIIDSLIIDGNGYLLSKDIGGGFGFFGARNAPVDVTIKNISVENGDSGVGNFFHGFNISSLSVTNSYFLNGNEGSLYGEGGSIYVYNVNKVNIMDSVFEGNMSSLGGVLFSTNSNVKVEKSIFKNNTSVDSFGSVFSVHSSDFYIKDSTFEDNNGSVIFTHGGIGENILSRLNILSSTFSANTNEDSGSSSVIKHSGSTITNIINSTFSYNTSEGATISSNELDLFSRIKISYSTFYGNSSVEGVVKSIYYPGDVHISNSIFSNNSVLTCDFGENANIVFANNLFDSLSCGENVNPAVGVDANLAFNGGLTRTHKLLPGSNAIDTAINFGTDVGCPKADQRGFVRMIDGNNDGVNACDIGAYEYRKKVRPSVGLTISANVVNPLPLALKPIQEKEEPKKETPQKVKPLEKIEDVKNEVVEIKIPVKETVKELQISKR